MPFSTKWKEINSEHSKIIFPAELEEKANEAANIIDYLYNFESKTLKATVKKLPVVLYNTSTVNNGYVGLRPWRSGWYITPSQYATDLNTDYWFYTLAAHEYRHAVQYTASNKNFTKFMSIFFGQSGILMGQYSYPSWFIEGDAVNLETALSDGGRGRVPQFEMGLRTILLSDKKISYNKAKLYTYKEYFPGKYNLGYSLVSYGRNKYGADIWDKVIYGSTKISFWPYAFSLSLKKQTGLNEKKFFHSALNHLDSLWTSEEKGTEYTELEIINKAEKKTWTKYTDPEFLNNGSIICKKASLDGDLTAFYIIDSLGNEKKIKNTDAGIYSVSGDKIVWSRHVPDLRWSYRNWSDIIIFDYKTKKEKRLTKKEKLFAPAVSPDGNIIVAVEYNSLMNSSLVFFDIKTGEQLKKIESPNNDYIRTPMWSADGKNIVYTNTSKEGTALSIMNYENNSIEEILPYSNENIGKPVFYNNYVIYNSPYSGVGNIYAVDIKTKERFLVVSSKYGAYNPRVNKNEMIFINYTAEGYDIAKIELNTAKWQKISKVKKHAFKRAEMLVSQEQGYNIFTKDSVPSKKYETKKYSKIKHSLNFHSWGIDSDLDSKIGLNIYTANVLNTVFGIAGAYYDINERKYSTNVTTRFSRFYPLMDIAGAYAQRNVFYQAFESYDEWTELRGKLSMTLPLNFSRGIYQRGLNLSPSYTYTYIIDKDLRYINESSTGTFSSLQYTATYYNFRNMAMRDIDPKFGQFVYVGYKHTPFTQINQGYQISVLGSLYFPGIFKHHSINLKAGYEKQRAYDAFDYWFSTPQSFTRGYDFMAFEEFSKLSIDYKFPVLYPEFGIGSLIYFTRIRAGFFYDYSLMKILGGINQGTFQSTGAEVFLQFYVLRLQQPFEIGARVSYLLDGSKSLSYDFLTFKIPF